MASWKSILTESHEVPSSSEEIVQLSNDLKSLNVDDGRAYSIAIGNMTLISRCDQILSNNDIDFEPFCSAYNQEHCIAYLNQEMISLGIASLYDSESANFNITRLVNAMYNLLQRFHQGLRMRESLEDSKHRTASDLEHHQQEKKRLRSTLEQIQRELAQEQLKQCDLLKVNNLLNNKLKSEKEEVKRLLTLIQSRDVQYRHSVRKMESELMKLKERLHLLLVEKTDRKINIDLSEALLRSDGKRGKWKTGYSNVEDLYRSVVSDCEEKQKMVLVENEELRQCLRELHKELASLLYHSTLQNDSEEEKLDEDVTISEHDLDESLPDGCFEMPYEMVADDIMSKLRRQIELLKPLLKKSDKSENAKYVKGKFDDEQHRNEIEKLRKKVERYRSLIEHTQKLYKHNMSTEHLLRTMSVMNADIVEERERLTLEKKHFYEQVASFHGDNGQLEAAVVELNNEEVENNLHQVLPYVRCRGQESREEECQHAQSKRVLPVTPSPCISTSTHSDNCGVGAAQCSSQPVNSNKNPTDLTVQRKSLERTRSQEAASVASISSAIDSQHVTAHEKRCNRPATAVVANCSSRYSGSSQGEIAVGQLSKTQKSSSSLVPSSPRSNVDLRTDANTILIGQTRHQKQK